MKDKKKKKKHEDISCCPGRTAFGFFFSTLPTRLYVQQSPSLVDTSSAAVAAAPRGFQDSGVMAGREALRACFLKGKKWGWGEYSALGEAVLCVAEHENFTKRDTEGGKVAASWRGQPMCGGP